MTIPRLLIGGTMVVAIAAGDAYVAAVCAVVLLLIVIVNGPGRDIRTWD